MKAGLARRSNRMILKRAVRGSTVFFEATPNCLWWSQAWSAPSGKWKWRRSSSKNNARMVTLNLSFSSFFFFFFLVVGGGGGGGGRGANRGFPTRMVYLCYISCLKYTNLAGNPRNALFDHVWKLISALKAWVPLSVFAMDRHWQLYNWSPGYRFTCRLGFARYCQTYTPLLFSLT